MPSSFAKAGSSGSEKRRKRMISNRESARRSRMKRQKHMERKIHEDNKKYAALWQRHFALESDNKALTDEKLKLAEYLKNLQQDLKVSDRFLNPWQVHGSVKSITTSGMFQV
ncbi:hypothetical protein NC652_025896 [Populus alba x Populus x berolinensis]|nr:hypothetical protein NC652_025896 [Populus alba x Populus x berolinensis]